LSLQAFLSRSTLQDYLTILIVQQSVRQEQFAYTKLFASIDGSPGLYGFNGRLGSGFNRWSDRALEIAVIAEIDLLTSQNRMGGIWYNDLKSNYKNQGASP
jgi:hypothetical protein